MSESYDYIVVGGGSSGCVAAGRLVKDFGMRVLLLEGGSNDDSPLVSMPAGSFKMMFGGGEFIKFHQSEAQPNLGGRSVPIPVGNLLGGGSSVNVMLYARGSRRDYDRWDEICGNAGWSWNDLLPHFRRQEGNQRYQNQAHGGDGPLKVSEQPHVVEGSDYFVRTMQGLGVPYSHDFNAGEILGVGYQQATVYRGERCNAARAFIDPVRGNSRLTISFHSRASRIIIENGRAVGVEYADRSGSKRAMASREVILTAGAFVTPKLLMLSGIGPAATLKKHGIKVISDQPGVGQNLMDHHSALLVGATNGPFGYHLQSSGWRMVRNALEYMAFRTGPVASTGSEAMAFVNLDGGPDPDFQLYALQIMWPSLAPKVDHGITLMANLMTPKSRGSVTLRSSDPADDPLIDVNWLSHPDDERRLIKAFHFLRKVLASHPLNSIVSAEVAPGLDVSSDEAILDYIRRTTVSNYHPCGTARMGRADDVNAVLTPDLRVKGVDGLRVMDASVFPVIVSANTNAPVMAVADRGIDMMMGCGAAPVRPSEVRNAQATRIDALKEGHVLS
jgi:choline dehydrogenase